MSLDFPVFDLKVLRKYFYYFFVSILVIAATCIVLVGLFDTKINPKLISSRINWIILVGIFLVTYLWGQQRKKELRTIVATQDFTLKFSLYETYYKKKLIWNAFSVLFIGTFWVLTNKNLFFYLLIFQVFFSIVFYPYRKIIANELKNPEIVLV